MKRVVLSFFKNFLFWLVYFWAAKLLFLLINFNLSRQLSFSELAKIFIIGTRMDLSMAAYLTVLPGLILALSFLFSQKFLNKTLRIYSVVILLAITFINLLDLALYPHWGTRVGINVFSYFGDPKEVLANITVWNGVAAISVYLIFFLSFNQFYKKFVLNAPGNKKLKWYFSPTVLFLTALLIIPMRGGFNVSPMNLSTVSFSEKLYVNQASANYLWNFFNTIERRKSYENPCIYFDDEKALEIFNRVEKTRTSTDTLLIHKTENVQPNVVLIILESFSNKVISALGGKYDVCPNLDSICNDAIIFPSFYSTGNRSDRGISALLGGYPSLLEMSIMRFPDKSDKLTLLSHYFNRHNYFTSFYYGGDIDFYSMKSFVLQGKYNRVVSQPDFPNEVRNYSKWGAPDGYLFNKVLNDIKNEKQPFFTVAYTLSSHPPFDVPFSKIKGNSTDDKFLNSVAYADSCIGAFVSRLKQLEIWKNTLVIITADHGALYPGSTEIREPASYRIPLIWTGGVIKKPGTIDYIGCEPDLMPTLIKQLGWQVDSTRFGHDIFSNPQYAFYMHDTGWGFIDKKQKFFFNRNTKKFKIFKIEKDCKPDFDFAKAYLQVLHNDFLNK